MALFRQPQVSSRNRVVPAAAGSIERTILPLTRWALYVWMFSLPFDVIVLKWLPSQLQGNLSISRIAGVILAVCFVIDPKTRPWKLPPASLAFAAFFAIFTVSMLRSGLASAVTVIQQFQLIVMFMVCYNLFLKYQATKGALLSYAISCGVASIMVLCGVAGSELVEDRLTAFGTNQNQYSELLAVGVLVAIGIGHIRRAGNYIQLPILWAIVICAMSYISLAGSRGQTLALAAGFAIFLLRKGSFFVIIRNVGLMFVIGGIAFFFFSHSDVLQERWTSTVETGYSSGRDKIYKDAIGMFLEKPIIGWGPSATSELAIRQNYSGVLRATHNNVLAMLTFTGLAGTIPYFWGYLTILCYACRARNGVENILPLAIFVALFVGDSFSGDLPEKLHWTFFAYILAAGGTSSSTCSMPIRKQDYANHGMPPTRWRKSQSRLESFEV